MTRFSKTFIALAIVFGVNSNALAECIAPSAPLIPDGNVASQDELVSAQGAYKAFEKTFYDYRDCLKAKELALDVNDADLDDKKAAIVAADDVAFAELNRLADEFNTAIKAFKAR